MISYDHAYYEEINKELKKQNPEKKRERERDKIGIEF